MQIPFLPTQISNLLFGNDSRYIAGIIPDVVIRERHDDEMTITDHPIGSGAPITDHAFKNPESVYIEFGWSNSFISLNSMLGGSIFAGAGNLMDAYNRLLQMQKNAEVISIGTGKRQYTNMLIKSLSVETDIDTENALVVKAIFRKIYIVSTGELDLKADEQKNPAETSSLMKNGERAVESVKNQATGALNAVKGGIEDKLSQVGGILDVGKNLAGQAQNIADIGGGLIGKVSL